MIENYKAEDSFDHFELLANDNNRSNRKIRTPEEKLYEQKNDIFDALSQLNISFESDKIYIIYQSLKSLCGLLEYQIYEGSPQIIPEQNIIQLFNIFQKFSERFIKEITLLLFSILIELSDQSNNNVEIMIKNSFLDIIFSFSNEIQNNTKLILNYIKIIRSLISFCSRNPNSKITDIIIQKIDFDIIFYLFELAKAMTKNEQVEWLLCCLDLFYYFKVQQKIISSEIFSQFLQLYRSFFDDEDEDSYFFSEILNALSSIINFDIVENTFWENFSEYGYPEILSNFSMKRTLNDNRLICASSRCICACCSHGFSDFEYNIDDVYKSARKYKDAEMCHELFTSYTLIASKNVFLIDSFFNEKTNNFLEKVENYSFKMKKEVAIFLSSMIELAQNQQHINFLVETQSILFYLYDIFTDTMDVDILSSILTSFLNLGQILISIYKLEELTEKFSYIIPYDFYIEDDCEFANENDNQNYILIKENFPFLLEAPEAASIDDEEIE